MVVRGIDQDGHAVGETLDMERPGVKSLAAFLEQKHAAIAAETAEIGGLDAGGDGPCDSCGKPGATCVDPFRKDVYDESVVRILCTGCYQERLDDI